MYTCGQCGKTWDYETPAGRCPYEYDHIEQPEPVSVATIAKALTAMFESAQRDYDVTGDVDSAQYYAGIMDACNDVLNMIEGGN